jgi:C4-dicarboxylate transporter DctM subunit
MDPIVILAVSFLAALLAGMPVAVVLGLSSLIYLLAGDIPLEVIPQKMFAGMDSFVLLCIPGFMLAGNLMNGGGITDRIMRFANALRRIFAAGSRMTNVVGSMIFGGISGTAVADAASQGSGADTRHEEVGYTGRLSQLPSPPRLPRSGR